jgi:hypothetical protein
MHHTATMTPTPEQLHAIDSALEKGNKIEAVKLYRMASGLDLKNSKDAVESRLEELRKLNPARFPPSQTGCLAVILILASLPSGLLLLVLAI